MWRGTLLLLGLWALLGSALGDLNETNILKISRQSRPNHRDHAASNSTEFVDRKRKNTLVAFSKNNPEQDWKKYLQVAESEEQDSLELDLDFAKDELRRTANSIQWLSDLYDPLSWSKVPGKLSERCRSDMDRFLQALRDGEPWAAKSAFPCNVITTRKLYFSVTFSFFSTTKVSALMIYNMTLKSILTGS